MFAVIKTGGKQYKVKENDTLRVEKLPKSTNGKVVFDNILLTSDGKSAVEIGQPLTKAKVEATVISEGKAKKVTVIKYKAKVRYKRTVGHRQHFTEVKIDKITA